MKFIYILLLLVSCTTVKQELNPKVYYMRDMLIEYNRTQYRGVAVLPKSDSYKIKFTSAGKLNAFIFSSCAREIFIENAKLNIPFENHKSTEIEIFLTELEKNDCPFYVSALSTDGVNSFGFIDKLDDKKNMEASVECNGYSGKVYGSYVCQIKFGLLQSISFENEMVVNGSCSLPTSSDKKKFLLKTPNRECVYNFMEIKEPHREFKLNSIGYEDFIIRQGL